MAIKGLVDLNAYEIGTYFTPEDYVNPPRSVGDYVVSDYVVVDYLLEALDLVSTTTLTCEATLQVERASLTSQFTITSLAGLGLFADKTLTSTTTASAQMSRTRSASPLSISTQATLQSPGGLLQRATASVSTNASVSVDANVLFDGFAQIQAEATTQQNGNLTITSFTTTFDAVATNVSVGGVIYDVMSLQEDYTWDDFAESNVIDRTWNEWFGGRWHPGLIAYTVSTIFKANGGLTASGSGVFTSVATTSIPVVGRIRSTLFQSTPQSEFTIDSDGNVIYAPSKSLSSQFTQQEDYIRFRNPGFKQLDSEFTSNQNGNQIFDQPRTQTYDVVFGSSQNANAIFGPSKSIDSVISFTSNGNVFYAGEVFDLRFFYSTLQFGRLITLPDPWNILTVNPEIRTFVVPIETRSLGVLQETRVNNTTTETRVIDVPQETRNFKIFRPQFTNRSSIPKIRTDL